MGRHRTKIDFFQQRKYVWVCKICGAGHDKEILQLQGRPKNCIVCKRPSDFYTFPSRKEYRRYGQLKLLELAGEISDLQMQVCFRFIKDGFEFNKYYADFVYFKDGLKIVEDVKGDKNHLTTEFKKKQKLMLAFEHIEIKIVDWS